MVNTEFLSKWKSKLRNFYLSERRKIKQYLNNKEIILKYIKDHIIFVLIYGFIFNYALFVALGVSFNIITVPGWGFAFYLFKEEIPEFVNDCRYPIKEER